MVSCLSLEAIGKVWRGTMAWRWRFTTEPPTPGRWSAFCQDFGSTVECAQSSLLRPSGLSFFPSRQHNSFGLMFKCQKSNLSYNAEWHVHPRRSLCPRIVCYMILRYSWLCCAAGVYLYFVSCLTSDLPDYLI